MIRVEPIDDADIDGFFELDSGVDVDFRGAYHDRLAVVPAAAIAGRSKSALRQMSARISFSPSSLTFAGPSADGGSSRLLVRAAGGAAWRRRDRGRAL